MAETAEVVVVGGGVVGASIAYHLAARGCRDVVVLDGAPRPGAGSTGRATGGFRAQFGTAINVRLSLIARDKLLRFADELGADPGYEPAGYLFLARAPEELEVLRATQAVQHTEGLLEATVVAAEEITDINPAVDAAGLVGGVFCPTDGFIRPLAILHGYQQAGERLGVRYFWGEPCTGLQRDRRRITGAGTPNRTIAAGHVVNAAGPWAADVAALAGLDLPVRPLRRQIATTSPTDRIPPDMPMTIFVEDGFHLGVRDGRVLLLQPDTPATTDPYSTSVDDAWVANVVRLAHQRIPVLATVPMDRPGCWAGLYEMSPDGHAILGAAPALDNFFLANGSSGHGVMHAPALGQLLAEILLDGSASSLDVRALRPERFLEGEANARPTLL